MTLANRAGDRCSRLRASKPLTPYSGSAERPRRPVLAPHGPPPDVPGRPYRELDNMKKVHDQGGLRQYPPSRALVDRAHVDRHDLHGVPPRRRLLGQPVRIVGAALHLPQQPLIPGQVKKAGMPLPA